MNIKIGSNFVRNKWFTIESRDFLALCATLSSAFSQTTNTTGTAPVTLTNTGDAPLSWTAELPTVDGNYTQAASTTPGSGVSFSWINAVNGGTKITFAGSDDENVGPIFLPFTFPFYGTNHTSLRICTNG